MSLTLFGHHTSRGLKGSRVFALLSFFQGKMLTSHSVCVCKRRGEDQGALLTPNGMFSFIQYSKQGPPTNNYFPLAIQTCLEKYQGLHYEERFKEA